VRIALPQSAQDLRDTVVLQPQMIPSPGRACQQELAVVASLAEPLGTSIFGWRQLIGVPP
jgi:hypothetical protein